MNTRTGAAAVILSAMLALTGCSGPGVNPAASSGDESGSEPSSPRDGDDSSQQHDSNTSASADDATPRGFQFESGFLEFGEFDPYTLGDDIFNPCTEITEEEFAAAGFEQMHYEARNGESLNEGISVCSFGGIDADRVAVGFSNGNLDKALADEGDLVLTDYSSELLPELYVVKPRSGRQSICYTQVDTVRGGFGSQVVDLSSQADQERVCERAISVFEQLFQIHGTAKMPN